MGLRLTVIGPAAAWDDRRGWPSSCYLVEAGRGTRGGDDAILLDMGQGSFAALARRRDPASLRAIFVSHLHPDHGIDLVPLRHWLRYGRAGLAAARIELDAPLGLRERHDALLGQLGFLEDFPGTPLASGRRHAGGLLIDVAPVTHAAPSFAFRVSLAAAGGAGLVYSGDCGRADDLLPLLRRGDTLLCEASFGAGPGADDAIHLTADEAGAVAARAGAARLVLTHIQPDRDRAAAARAARSAFAGQVILARPGLEVELD